MGFCDIIDINDIIDIKTGGGNWKLEIRMTNQIRKSEVRNADGVNSGIVSEAKVRRVPHICLHMCLIEG